MFGKNSVSNLPPGVAVRKLTETRRAQGQKRVYKFSAWYHSANKQVHTVYGNTVKECVEKLEDHDLAVLVGA